MDSVLYSPDRDTLHGGRVSQFQQMVQHLGGSVCAWCWILADSGRFFIAKTARELELTESKLTHKSSFVITSDIPSLFIQAIHFLPKLDCPFPPQDPS